MNIPASLLPLVNNDRAEQWRIEASSLRALINECESTSGCDAIVERLRPILATVQGGVESYENGLRAVLAAHENLESANAAAKESETLFAAGAADRKEALRLRDDRDVADARRRHCASRAEATRAALPILAMSCHNEGSAMTRAQRIVETMASVCVARAFPRASRLDAKVAESVWAEWVELHEDWLVYGPLFLGRALVAAQEVWSRNENDANKIVANGDSRQPHPDELRALWSQLIEERKGYRAARVDAARRVLSSAEAAQ